MTTQPSYTVRLTDPSGLTCDVLDTRDCPVEALRQATRHPVHQPGLGILYLIDADKEVGDFTGRVERDPVGQSGQDLGGDGFCVPLELIPPRLAQREHVLSIDANALVARRSRNGVHLTVTPLR